MVITFVQKKRTQKYLILVLIVVITAIAFVFISGFLKDEEIFVGEPQVSQYFLPIEIDFQVLSDPVFEELSESFPDLPSLPPRDELGRKNPFIPY